MSAVRAVLWDADGVLQQTPGEWMDRLVEAVGPERVPELMTAIAPLSEEAIRGRISMRDRFDEVLSGVGLGEQVPVLAEVWGSFERFEDTRELIGRLRANGVLGALATNQDDLRAAYMRERLGYDDLLDRVYYSCDLGHAKPDAAFFEHACGDLGLRSGEVAFVDDSAANVAGARELGLPALHWHHREGLEVLEDWLRSQGLETGEH